MGVRVAYGKKSKITSAIASGVIPKDSLIITSDYPACRDDYLQADCCV